MRRKVLGVVAIVAVAIAAVLAGFYFREGAAPEISAAQLLSVALPDTDGKDQVLGQWTGKVMVVNFWATWCEPCRAEMPEFVKIQAADGPKGVQFVGIAIDQVDKIRQFSADLHLNYPSLVGGYGALELSKGLGNKLMALPFTVIIDRRGGLAYTQLGPMKPDKLNAIIGKLL